MEKITKIISILIFTILILIVGTVIWSFFNPYAQILLLPLGLLSVYFLLLISFTKLLKTKDTKFWKYLILVMIVIPIIAFAFGYETFIRFSTLIIEQFSRK